MVGLPPDSAYARTHQQHKHETHISREPRVTSTPDQFRAAGGQFVYAPRGNS